MSRVIAVCGYSEGSATVLHPICVARLRRAEGETTADDVVVLSGWARRGSGVSEAELMAGAWTAPCRELIVDSGARSTAANVNAAARVARKMGATEVVLVTSGWHGRRAAALLRQALRGSGAELVLGDHRRATLARHAAARARVLDRRPPRRAQRISMPPLTS